MHMITFADMIFESFRPLSLNLECPAAPESDLEKFRLACPQENSKPSQGGLFPFFAMAPDSASMSTPKTTSTASPTTTTKEAYRIGRGGETKECGEKVPRLVMPFLLAAFLIMTNLILFNLLIAMFKYAPPAICHCFLGICGKRASRRASGPMGKVGI